MLLGQRTARARFMPGWYVFPGGRIDPGDTRPWWSEDKAAGPDPLRWRAAARAALRETFEETGLLIGAPATMPPKPKRRGLSVVEEHYHAQGIEPAFTGIAPMARAITPSISPIRFHARFFLGRGDLATGEISPSNELDDVGWHKVEDALDDKLSDVTQFMLRHAVGVWRREVRPGIPLFHYRGKSVQVVWAEPI